MTLEKFLKKLDCDYTVNFNTLNYFEDLSINIEMTRIKYDIRDYDTDKKIKRFLDKNGYMIIFENRNIYNRGVYLVVVAPEEKSFYKIYSDYEKKSIYECNTVGHWLCKKGMGEKRNNIFGEIMARHEKKCRAALEL